MRLFRAWSSWSLRALLKGLTLAWTVLRRLGGRALPRVLASLRTRAPSLSRRAGWRTYGAAASVTLLLAAWWSGSADAAPSAGGSAPKRVPSVHDYTAGLDLRRHGLEGDALVAQLPQGRRAVLTLDPSLQEFASQIFARYEVPYAGLVAVEPSTGRLLAYVSHSSADPSADDQALDASAPAASVFKLITSAALLEQGLTPSTQTCYHGGFRSLDSSHLRDQPGLDKACVPLHSALGRSLNAVFAKLAVRHLQPDHLERYASAFGFGHALPFDVKVAPSAYDIPEESLEFAKAAAGFWHANLSPLHGAMIAATIANRGRMMRPHAVREVREPNGRVLARQSPGLFRSVLERRTAELLGRMMTTTVERGTARKTFYDEKGNAFLPNISVAGKTGSLSRDRPYRGYSWWVGFAPADEPRIALAALVVNSPHWRIKATYAAREALRHYLVAAPRARAKTAQGLSPELGGPRPR